MLEEKEMCLQNQFICETVGKSMHLLYFLISVFSILDLLFAVCGPKGFPTVREKRNSCDRLFMHFSPKTLPAIHC